MNLGMEICWMISKFFFALSYFKALSIIIQLLLQAIVTVHCMVSYLVSGECAGNNGVESGVQWINYCSAW
jgi:hypothetical protein